MTYSVEYSRRKTISISVKGGVLVVKAPLKTKKRDIETILERHQKWINKHLEIEALKQSFDNSLTEEQIKALRRSARTYLKDRTDYYSNKMGLKYSRITITGAKTRFGSCSSKGNISYSYRLMLYPEAAREYVVVHELAHLAEMNHSRKFWSIVEQHMPDYRSRRDLLKNLPEI